MLWSRVQNHCMYHRYLSIFICSILWSRVQNHCMYHRYLSIIFQYHKAVELNERQWRNFTSCRTCWYNSCRRWGLWEKMLLPSLSAYKWNLQTVLFALVTLAVLDNLLFLHHKFHCFAFIFSHLSIQSFWHYTTWVSSFLNLSWLLLIAIHIKIVILSKMLLKQDYQEYILLVCTHILVGVQ